eukprot:scaffold11.g3891.t1
MQAGGPHAEPLVQQYQQYQQPPLPQQQVAPQPPLINLAKALRHDESQTTPRRAPPPAPRGTWAQPARGPRETQGAEPTGVVLPPPTTYRDPDWDAGAFGAGEFVPAMAAGAVPAGSYGIGGGSKGVGSGAASARYPSQQSQQQQPHRGQLTARSYQSPYLQAVAPLVLRRAGARSEAQLGPLREAARPLRGRGRQQAQQQWQGQQLSARGAARPAPLRAPGAPLDGGGAPNSGLTPRIAQLSAGSPRYAAAFALQQQQHALVGGRDRGHLHPAAPQRAQQPLPAQQLPSDAGAGAGAQGATLLYAAGAPPPFSKFKDLPPGFQSYTFPAAPGMAQAEGPKALAYLPGGAEPDGIKAVHMGGMDPQRPPPPPPQQPQQAAWCSAPQPGASPGAARQGPQHQLPQQQYAGGGSEPVLPGLACVEQQQQSMEWEGGGAHGSAATPLTGGTAAVPAPWVQQQQQQADEEAVAVALGLPQRTHRPPPTSAYSGAEGAPSEAVPASPAQPMQPRQQLPTVTFQQLPGAPRASAGGDVTSRRGTLFQEAYASQAPGPGRRLSYESASSSASQAVPSSAAGSAPGSRSGSAEAAAAAGPGHRRPATPAQALQQWGQLLTPYEKSEILRFRQVWFVGRQGTPKVQGDTMGPEPNGGYDDSRGDYLTVVGDHISYRFEVLDVLGRGSFGQVLRCVDHASGQAVALKIIRNKKRFQKQAQIEANILAVLMEQDPDDSVNIVRTLDSFTFRNHLCITFELLRRAGHIAWGSLHAQVLVTLRFLGRLNIVHCDLKPENILLRERGRTAIKVILGHPYGPEIDIWSLGCIMAELFTGQPIFPGEDEKEQLAWIMEVLGVPPRSLLEGAPRAHVFFDASGAPLPCPPNSRGRTHRVGASSLQRAMRGCDDALFIDFLQGCLRWDPALRLTPELALQHPWIQGSTGEAGIGLGAGAAQLGAGLMAEGSSPWGHTPPPSSRLGTSASSLYRESGNKKL